MSRLRPGDITQGHPMKMKYKLALTLVAGVALGGAAIQGLQGPRFGLRRQRAIARAENQT